MGLTYAKLGKLDQSQAVFEQVLQKDPDNTKTNANLKQITTAIEELKAMAPEPADLNEDQQKAKNKRNDSMEDLSGGGQEATKEDMKKERREEVAQAGKKKQKNWMTFLMILNPVRDKSLKMFYSEKWMVIQHCF